MFWPKTLPSTNWQTSESLTKIHLAMSLKNGDTHTDRQTTKHISCSIDNPRPILYHKDCLTRTNVRRFDTTLSLSLTNLVQSCFDGNCRTPDSHDAIIDVTIFGKEKSECMIIVHTRSKLVIFLGFKVCLRFYIYI